MVKISDISVLLLKHVEKGPMYSVSLSSVPFRCLICFCLTKACASDFVLRLGGDLLEWVCTWSCWTWEYFELEVLKKFWPRHGYLEQRTLDKLVILTSK